MMPKYRKALKHYFDFLWAMTEKEIKVRYKRAVFGFLWIILNPLLQMLIIGIVFSYFIKIENYFLFLFGGLLLWQFFSLSLQKATPSFVYERSLIQKAKFRKEVIPASIILSNYFNLLISIAMLILFLLLTEQLNDIRIWLLIPALIWILMFTIGLSLLTSSLNVRYRDVAFFVQTALILLFYATPILYSLDLVPQQVLLLYYLNPLSSIFVLSQIAITGKGQVAPSLLVSNMLISISLITLGLVVYRKNHRHFVDWL
ncbi:MAG: hypothetical protein A2785_02585 [Candidatus Chisholmbacteria bacterium RIFCSPHIGHO2_01_FULL_49_18]|uniref:Transport permease protein n=1 Tax=Candidatus Chisholmbacteria bacterium RIFCSPHIGHO2_01_FULL_49_18 TaxID=1797590 RepID=A0A1G1VKY7_9BACT|nr:MAG: hypothetical protein A2785_02585 [Candidatus Chisholmbacteria bacterium RIFCSPHIGHO2_01_FULL_49_18]